MANKILETAILTAILFSLFFTLRVSPIADADFYIKIADLIGSQMAIFTPEQLNIAGTHPLLVPLLYAFFGKQIFTIIYAGLLLIFYWNLKKHISETSALLWTFLLTGFPLILYHSVYVYCDLPMAFFYLGGMVYLYEYFCKKDIRNLVISAIFLGLGVHVKASGLPLLITAVGMLLLYLIFENRKIKDGLIFLFTSGLIALPQLISRCSLIYNHKNFSMNFLSSLNGRIITIPSYTSLQVTFNFQSLWYWIGRRLFTYADWQLLWFAFIFVVIFYWQRIWRSSLKYLLISIIINLGMIFYVFSHSNYFVSLVDGTLIQRLIMHFVPVALYFVALAKEKEK